MFTKGPVAPPRSPSPRLVAANGATTTFSVLGADVLIVGDLTADTDLHIDGRIEGDIRCATLVQGEGSEITGAIRVSQARLGGIVRGSVEARELVILRTARISGDVRYEALTIEQGAQVDGRFAPQALELVTPVADDVVVTLAG